MKAILLLLFSLFLNDISAQVKLVAQHYNERFETGTYTNKSIDSTKLASIQSSITPQTSIALFNDKTAFIFPPDEGIVLFKDRFNPSQAGKLIAPSLISIDTIFYNRIFLDNSLTSYTFDVWYAIKINGDTYYTDYQPHQLLAFQHNLVDHQQLFTLFAQNTGYDNYFDSGYPNYFHAAVFSTANKILTLFYSSETLPYDCGEEFWVELSNREYHYSPVQKELEISLDGVTSFKASWNGKTLSQKTK